MHQTFPILCPTDFPNAWILETVYDPDKTENDDDSDSDSEARDAKSHLTLKGKSSEAYREFLQFLELGCAGSPVDGYPTVLVVLSTIPSSVCMLPSIIQIVNLYSRLSRRPLGQKCP